MGESACGAHGCFFMAMLNYVILLTVISMSATIQRDVLLPFCGNNGCMNAPQFCVKSALSFFIIFVMGLHIDLFGTVAASVPLSTPTDD
jgi:hypothetical protein